MTGALIAVSLKDADDALAPLAGYIARAGDKRGLFENIGASVQTSTMHRFETSKAPDGSLWPPSLRVKQHGGITLRLTARLMRSITYQADSDSVQIGTNVVYAAIHQFGGLIQQAARTAVLHFKTNKKTGQSRFAKPGKADRAQKAAIGAHTITMPARPFLGLDDDDEREILSIAEQWVAGEQGGAPA
ncbi:phage virion morphogenesis protein [Rhodopseudomonas pseudopalustris]|uniref:Phage virion morphogenesis (Putative tail completion) protein n=1 Tax=Rhodopseudomonas pseudopalustris TaxID=1513892 RepID=A0A1H8V8E9_9BRAD|nr:phage virion morphogenesis protein [Rhodopseudomonas pseudopalustris]SEP11740.1 phage virion morphogenesis (putative tail completion) protein [Rhodopseudomonas pseudopalustris]